MSLALKIKNLRNSSADFCFIPFKNAFQPYLVLFLVSMSIYVNTLTHEVAFDDVSVMLKNEYVIKGIKGIPEQRAVERQRDLLGDGLAT